VERFTALLHSEQQSVDLFKSAHVALDMPRQCAASVDAAAHILALQHCTVPTVASMKLYKLLVKAQARTLVWLGAVSFNILIAIV
jgi:hypothetical protein